MRYWKFSLNFEFHLSYFWISIKSKHFCRNNRKNKLFFFKIFLIFFFVCYNFNTHFIVIEASRMNIFWSILLSLIWKRSVSTTTFSITTFGIKTLNIMTFNIVTFSMLITTLSWMMLNVCMLTVIYPECICVECRK